MEFSVWSGVLGGLGAAVPPGHDFPEHPASTSLGLASSPAPKQQGNNRVKQKEGEIQGQAWILTWTLLH